MRFNEDTQQLITCSKDKTIKIWQLPEYWVNEQGTKTESATTSYHQEPSNSVTQAH